MRNNKNSSLSVIWKVLGLITSGFPVIFTFSLLASAKRRPNRWGQKGFSKFFFFFFDFPGVEVIEHKIVVVACKDIYRHIIYRCIYIYTYKNIHVHTYIKICLVIRHWNWTYFSCYDSYTSGMDQSSRGEHMPCFYQVVQQLHPFFSLDRWRSPNIALTTFQVSLKLSKNGHVKTCQT